MTHRAVVPQRKTLMPQRFAAILEQLEQVFSLYSKSKSQKGKWIKAHTRARALQEKSVPVVPLVPGQTEQIKRTKDGMSCRPWQIIATYFATYCNLLQLIATPL